MLSHFNRIVMNKRSPNEQAPRWSQRAQRNSIDVFQPLLPPFSPVFWGSELPSKPGCELSERAGGAFIQAGAFIQHYMLSNTQAQIHSSIISLSYITWFGNKTLHRHVSAYKSSHINLHVTCQTMSHLRSTKRDSDSHLHLHKQFISWSTWKTNNTKACQCWDKNIHVVCQIWIRYK